MGRPLYSRTSCDDPRNERETTSPRKTTPMRGVYKKMKRFCPRVEQMAVSSRNAVSHRCFDISLLTHTLNVREAYFGRGANLRGRIHRERPSAFQATGSAGGHHQGREEALLFSETRG